MTPYASDLVDYIEQHNYCGRMLAELWCDENLAPDWREHTEQPLAFDSGFSVDGGDDEN